MNVLYRYYPNVVYVDRDLVLRTRASLDVPQFGRLPQIMSFSTGTLHHACTLAFTRVSFLLLFIVITHATMYFPTPCLQPVFWCGVLMGRFCHRPFLLLWHSCICTPRMFSLLRLFVYAAMPRCVCSMGVNQHVGFIVSWSTSHIYSIAGSNIVDHPGGVRTECLRPRHCRTLSCRDRRSGKVALHSTYSTYSISGLRMRRMLTYIFSKLHGCLSNIFLKLCSKCKFHAQEGRAAALAIYRRRFEQAESILLSCQPPLLWRAIEMNLSLHRYERYVFPCLSA